MYEQAYMSIGKGLRLVFFGEILFHVAGLFSWPVLSLVGQVMTLVGLITAGHGDSGYRKAFTVIILNPVVTFAGMLLADVFLAFIPKLADLFTAVIFAVSEVLNFLFFYYICNTSAALLEGRSYPLSLRAEGLWKFYGFCTAITVVCVLLLAIPFLPTMVLAGLLGIISSLVMVLAGVLCVAFLYQASEVFLHW